MTATPPVEPTAPQGKTSPGRIAVIAVCALSLIIGLVGVVIGLMAYSEAAKARDEVQALTGGQNTQPQAGPANGGKTTTTAPATTSAPAPRTTTEALDPRATFSVGYPQETLTLTPAGSCNSQYLDLDQPAVLSGTSSSATADIEITMSCSSSPPVVDVSYGQFADAGGKRMTPNECVETIRRAPTQPGGQGIPLRKGVTVCLATSAAKAVQHGISRKVVLLEVVELRSDGKIDLRVDAWTFPN